MICNSGKRQHLLFHRGYDNHAWVAYTTLCAPHSICDCYFFYSCDALFHCGFPRGSDYEAWETVCCYWPFTLTTGMFIQGNQALVWLTNHNAKVFIAVGEIVLKTKCFPFFFFFFFNKNKFFFSIMWVSSHQAMTFSKSTVKNLY